MGLTALDRERRRDSEASDGRVIACMTIMDCTFFGCVGPAKHFITDGSKTKPNLNVNARYFKFSTVFTFRTTFRPTLNIAPSVVLLPVVVQVGRIRLAKKEI